MSLILALQIAAAAPVPAPPATVPPASSPLAAIEFDLARYRPAGAGTCGSVSGADVLVCGPRRGGAAFPLDHWARIFPPPRPIRAEMDLGGNVQGRIHAEAVPMDRGAVSNRFMVGIRMPF